MFGGYMYAGAPFGGAGNMVGQVFTKTLTETITNGDSAARLIAFFKQLNESITPAGTLTSATIYARTFAENITSTAVFNRTWTATRTYTETITLTPNVSLLDYLPNKRIRILGVSINDFPRVLVADDKSRKSGTKIDNTGYLRITLKK